MLHIIKTSPFARTDFEQCMEFVKAGDSILFIQDGVITTSSMHKHALRLQQLSGIAIYSLSEDLLARGLTVSLGETVDYAGFVQLTTKESHIQTW